MPDLPLPDLTCQTSRSNAPRCRQLGITAFFAVAALLCTGASLPAYGQSSSSGRIGPSGGEVAGAAIGIGAAIAVAIILPIEISRSHHILTGCVASSTNGLELQTSDGKTYALEGDAATIKVGDKVKVHGSRIKKAKGSASPGVFRVEKLNRDYGSCSVESTSSSPAH